MQLKADSERTGLPDGYYAFFEALVSGRLKLGQTLKQEELAATLGVTLSPMREITTLLESEGLVTVRRRTGITIFYPDVKFVGNSFQLRGLLEREGLRKFARVVTPQWIAAMREAHAEVLDHVQEVRTQDIFRFRVKAMERHFHETFVTVYENDQITTIYRRLADKMYLIRLHNPISVDESNTIVSMNEHLAVVDALEQGNADAAVAALDKHLQGVLHRVLTT